jgi:SsrA-binding protein
MAKGKANKSKQDVQIVNRRARHQFEILDTMEVGVVLIGSEVKSVRAGKVSLAEGYVRAQETPLALTLHGVHIAEYQPAGVHNHQPDRMRILLAHKAQTRSLAAQSQSKGVTIVPLKMYFKNNRIKLQIGVARGKGKSDKRQDLREREHQREMERAMVRKRL